MPSSKLLMRRVFGSPAGRPRRSARHCGAVGRAEDLLENIFGEVPPGMRGKSRKSFGELLVANKARLAAWECKDGVNDPRIVEVLKALDGHQT